MDADIFQTLLVPKARDIERQIVIAFRAGGMRLGGEVAMLLLLLVWGRNGAELLLDGLLLAGADRGVAGHVGVGVLGLERGGEQEGQGGRRATVHG